MFKKKTLTSLAILSLFLFPSCDSTDDTAELMEMRGFFLSIDKTNKQDCQYEDADVYIDKSNASGRADVEILAAGEAFEGSEFGHRGVQVEKGDQKIIVTHYVTETNGNFDNPGSYYLASTIDPEFSPTEKIYTGFWAGHAVRPEGNPVVICPYVLVPINVLTDEEKNEENCMVGTKTREKIKKYFGDNTCTDNPYPQP